jgi:hypothetical protein
MNLIWQILPPELQSAPGLLAGFLTLLGLILCATGVKVARPMAAALMGAAFATLAASVMPGLMQADPWIAALIGLVVGLVIGAVAFRAMQGMILALCVGVVAGGIFYQWQTPEQPVRPVHQTAVLQFAPGTTGAKVLAALPANMQTNFQMGVARWEAIPQSLRQSMLVVGLGAAVLAAAIAWVAPRSTTWAMSATAGALMLLCGLYTLANAYLPQYAQRMPTEPRLQLMLLGGVVLAGMVVQRVYFWPKKKKKDEETDGEPAAA